jgi:hypothetical protein
MSRAFEYLLKAENYALAAKMAEGRKRMALLGAAAYWRNRAFDARMGGLRRPGDLSEGAESASKPGGLAG